MTTILNSNILEFGFLLGFWVFQLGFWVLKNPKTQVGWVFRKTHMGGSTLPLSDLLNKNWCFVL